MQQAKKGDTVKQGEFLGTLKTEELLMMVTKKDEILNSNLLLKLFLCK